MTEQLMESAAGPRYDLRGTIKRIIDPAIFRHPNDIPARAWERRSNLAGEKADQILALLSAAPSPLGDPWETFCDRSYYDLWCVRRGGERTFGAGFHLTSAIEAIALAELLNSLTAPLQESTPGASSSAPEDSSRISGPTTLSPPNPQDGENV